MDSSRIFVKGLPPNLNEADLRKHFASKGQITDVKLIPHRRIGYVGYKTSEEASNAIKYFNRSFVRMSKISVELARPIADPSLIKTKERRNWSSTTDTIKTTPQPTPSTEAQSENAKKRKREAVDESDPKLQEFLSVMKTANTTTSEIHGVVAKSAEEPPAKYAALAAKGGESDDEYEAVPTRQKKTRSLEKEKEKEKPVTSEVEKRISQPPEDIVMTEEPAEEQTVQPTTSSTETPNQPAATDDDWLRSRTNRLLDLVDDEDIVPAAEPPKHPSSNIPDAEEQGEPEVIDATIEEDQDMKDLSQEPEAEEDELVPEPKDNDLESVRKTRRLFVRNLPYSATEDDLKSYFAGYGDIEEVHMPKENQGKNRGIGFVLFANSDDATNAFQADHTSFQGRIIHVLPGSAKRDHNLDEYALSKLPLKQQNLIKKRAKAAESRFNWNSLYMNQDAVNASVADRLGISKAELLDPTNSDAAVKQAIAETSTIQDTKAYLIANGVDLNAFKSGRRGDTTILVKNFSYGTTAEEIRNLFEEHGQVLKVLLPPTGTIAIVQFAQAPQAKAAFAKLAYRRFKDSILFLEKAPENLLASNEQQSKTLQVSKEPNGVQKLSVSELLEQGNDEPVETSSLFVKNLHWDTTTEELANEFKHLEGFRSAQVKTKKDPKKPGQLLSMGFGFVSFSDKASAAAASKVMDGHILRSHKLSVRGSHRGRDAAEERRQEDNAKKAANHRTKIVIKNIPFQTNKKDIRTLLSTYGQLKSVRIPKKFNSTARGFAFAEFVSPKEAESAMTALQDTHLLGRRLVLEYAEAEAIDAEEEIAKMQRKVGSQTSKVALQQLTGGSRKKVTLGDDADEGDI